MARFRERVPPPILAPLAASVWSYETSRSKAGWLRVLPDGSTDLLVRFDVTVGGPPPPPVVTVVGPAERYQMVELRPGTVWVGVRFRPEAAGVLLRVSPAELAGREVGVAACSPHLMSLRERLTWRGSPEDVVAALVDTLSSFVPAGPGSGVAGRVRRAVELFGAGRPDDRVSGVARELGVTERTLHRDVRAATGLAPKTLARVLRFQRTLAALKAATTPDLCAAALDGGYADQSHMSREFRHLSGLPPAALLA